jgi:hypothetical protein
MTYTSKYSGLSPASRACRPITRSNSFLSACGFILLAVAASSFAQEAQNAVPPNPNSAQSSDFARMLEGLRKAKPMPDPPNGLKPNVLTPSGDLSRFDPLTGRTVKVAASKVPVATSGIHREGGHLGAAPTSANGRSQSTSPQPTPMAIFRALSSAKGSISPDITPTPPSQMTVPYFQPFNTEFALMMRFVVPGHDDQFFLCSASAISDFHLLSAGHCVYNHDPLQDGSGTGAGFAAEMWAWPAQTDVVDPVYPQGWTDFPYGVAKMTFQTTYNAWIDNSDFNWDMSFISLDRRVGDHTGWMPREWGVEATGLLFDGYPKEAPFVAPDNPFQYMGFDDGNVVSYTCCRIQMDALIYGGHSGGGVFHFTNGAFTIQGVNSTSDRVGSATATRFTAQNNADLLNAIANDQSVRPPEDRAEVIEYVFNDTSKGLVDTSVAVGNSFTFTLNAFNAGYIPSRATGASVYLTKFPFEHDFASGTFVGLVSLGNLDPMQFTVQNGTITVPPFIQPGLYYVGWILNADNFQYDSDDRAAIITKGLLRVVGLSAVLTNPNTVVGGATSTGTVELSSAAPPAGMTIALSSNNPAVQIPSLVSVSGGASSATFPIRTSGVTNNTVATITASSGGVSVNTGIQVKPQSQALSALSLAPASVVGSKTSTATVTLISPASAGGTNVTLSSSNTNAKVPTSVHVNAGATSATFAITTSAVGSTTTASIKATFSGTSKTATLTIRTAALTSLHVAPSTLTGGKSSVGTVTLNGPVKSGGINIPLSSSSASTQVPATVHVNGGATSGTFTITTSAVSSVTAASINATRLGVSKAATLTINPPVARSAVPPARSTRLAGIL